MHQTKYPEFAILVVDDEENVLLNVRTSLSSAGMNNILLSGDSTEVMDILADKEVGVVILDIMMPHITGMELMESIRQEYPQMVVIMITALMEVETVVECMRAGVYDYVTKPLSGEKLIPTVQHAVDNFKMKREIHFLRKSLSAQEENLPAFSAIVTNDPKMRTIMSYANEIAHSPASVLITGETGVGKELFARAIHDASGRTGKFMAVNLAGLDEQMFQDTLFGHCKGAFTGADRDRVGMVKRADGGTLFLDEIGDLGPQAQVKLLRFLDDRKFQSIGEDLEQFCDTRIIAATNRDLENLQKRRFFRPDLFFRLETHQIHVPPLRLRKGDLPVLVEYFLKNAATRLDRQTPDYPEQLITVLNSYDFPGNIRQLKGMVDDAVSTHKRGTISLESFYNKIYPNRNPAEEMETIESVGKPAMEFPEKLPLLKDIANLLVDEAMKRSGNNQSLAARMLGISRQTLNSRLTRRKKNTPCRNC